MSNQRSETRKEGQSRKGAGSHLPLKRIPEHRTYSLLVHYWGARFQSPIKSNMVTRFILPLGRPWNLCPFEPAHTAVKGWRPLNLGEPVWLHPLPASWLSGYWLTRSLMHLGGILPHSPVALSGWNGPNYLPIHITQTKSSFKQRSWTNKLQHKLQMVSKHLKDTGMTQRDGLGREVGRGFRMGNTCTPVVDSCWCMAKPIQYCKVISL